MPESLNNQVRTFEADVDKVHQLLHGGPGDSVTTEHGQLRSFAGLQADLVSQYDAAVNRTEAARSKVAADNSASAAQVAEAAAEAARDAAQLAAGVFPDIAAGLLATADGGYFSVPSPDISEHLVLYRHSAGAAAEIKRYPSSAALDGMRALLARLSADLIRTQAIIAGHHAFT